MFLSKCPQTGDEFVRINLVQRVRFAQVLRSIAEGLLPGRFDLGGLGYGRS
jgi:hypothetical protein